MWLDTCCPSMMLPLCYLDTKWWEVQAHHTQSVNEMVLRGPTCPRSLVWIWDSKDASSRVWKTAVIAWSYIPSHWFLFPLFLSWFHSFLHLFSMSDTEAGDTKFWHRKSCANRIFIGPWDIRAAPPSPSPSPEQAQPNTYNRSSSIISDSSMRLLNEWVVGGWRAIEWSKGI